MADIIQLKNNLISKRDKGTLERFGAYLMATALAYDWYWRETPGGDEVFSIHLGMIERGPVINVRRNREAGAYFAYHSRSLISSGNLEAVLADIDEFLEYVYSGTPGYPS